MTDTEQSTGNVDADLDARAAAALEAIQSAPKEPADDATETDAPLASPVAETPSEEDAAAKARRDRMASRQAEIQRLAEEERARVAASKARRAARQETAPKAPSIPIADETSFFAAAEAAGVSPQKLADWLAGANSPERVATEAAKRTLSPVEERIKEQAEKLAALERQIAEREHAANEARLIEQNTKILFDHLESVAHEAPLSARFQKKSPEKFLEAVDGICRQLPSGFTAQDVIDNLEEFLSELQLNGSPIAQATKNSPTKPQPKPAAAPANVGNRLAAERATTVESDDEDSLDLESRAARLKAQLARA